MYYTDYLGTSLAYPLSVNSLGRPDTVSGMENVKQSMIRILSEPTKSRFFNRRYGSDLETLLFEPNDTVLRSLLEEFITTSIEAWEKRVKILSITYNFKDQGDTIDCLIAFRILPSNEIDNFVWPFYRNLKY